MPCAVSTLEQLILGRKCGAILMLRLGYGGVASLGGEWRRGPGVAVVVVAENGDDGGGGGDGDGGFGGDEVHGGVDDGRGRYVGGG